MTDRRVTALVICLLFAFYVLLASLRIESGDGEMIYQVTRSMIEGRGFAIPHVRSREAREFLFGVARSTPGLHFDSLDDGLVHIFMVFISPPHDDQLYLNVYKRIAEGITTTSVFDDLMAAQDEGEIIRAMKLFD